MLLKTISLTFSLSKPASLACFYLLKTAPHLSSVPLRPCFPFLLSSPDTLPLPFTLINSKPLLAYPLIPVITRVSLMLHVSYSDVPASVLP